MTGTAQMTQPRGEFGIAEYSSSCKRSEDRQPVDRLAGRVKALAPRTPRLCLCDEVGRNSGIDGCGFVESGAVLFGERELGSGEVVLQLGKVARPHGCVQAWAESAGALVTTEKNTCKS